MESKTSNTLQDAINFIEAYIVAYHKTIFGEIKSEPPESWVWLLRTPRGNLYQESDYEIEFYYDKGRELVCFHLIPAKGLYEPEQVIKSHAILKENPPKLLRIKERKDPPYPGIKMEMDSMAEGSTIQTPKGEIKVPFTFSAVPVIGLITINLKYGHLSKKSGDEWGKEDASWFLRREKNWWVAKRTLKNLEADFPQAKDRIEDLTTRIEELLSFKKVTEQVLGDSSSKVWVVYGFQGQLNEFKTRLDGFEKRLDDFKTKESLGWKRLSFYVALVSFIVSAFIGIIGLILKVLKII